MVYLLCEDKQIVIGSHVVAPAVGRKKPTDFPLHPKVGMQDCDSSLGAEQISEILELWLGK